MPYSIQNSETGELDYIFHESNTIQQQKYDEETGEPVNGKYKVRYAKYKRFHIPKEYLRGTKCEEFEKEMTGEYIRHPPSGSIQSDVTPRAALKTSKKQYKREDYINMEGVKNEIILGYNKANFRVFFLPSLFCFNAFFAFLLSLLELVLHFWAHKKNGLNMNKKFYYRSPLHVLTSQFCATCRSESEMDIKIFDMLNKQMRLARKSQALKDVSKAIS